MKQRKGYIYIRNHPAYDNFKACKLGRATNIPERDAQYATGEIKRGYFGVVYEFPNKYVCSVEQLLHRKFHKYNIRYDAGQEFYNKKIMPLIEPYIASMRIPYRKLTRQEVAAMVRNNRIKCLRKLIIEKRWRVKLPKYTKAVATSSGVSTETATSYIPRDYQNTMIEKAISHFREYNKGILIIPCGVGKTLISLWIAQKLHANTILIGVPNKLLLWQWKNVICTLFNGIPYLTVSSGVRVEDVRQFLLYNTQCIIITTYASSYKVYKACHEFKFDMKILDEAHHLTTNSIKLSPTKSYIRMLEIPMYNQLSLTATIKELKGTDENIVSNDNIEYFGQIIDRKPLLWAITENIICDYVIQTIIADEEQLNEHTITYDILMNDDKRLFLSAFGAMKSIMCGHSHHVLIYANNRGNLTKLIHYIGLLLKNEYFDIPELYYADYHGGKSRKVRDNIVSNFEKARYGIITCVYCLGEGWDFPILDGVVFAENMTSNIRIVQSALRPCRKDRTDEFKIAKIILPILNTDGWLDDDTNTDLKKVRKIIYQMGLEDETITHKIKVLKISIAKQTATQTHGVKRTEEFGEYNEALTDKLRLKTINRNRMDMTYDRARKIIAAEHITSKKEYYELCKRDSRLPEEPETEFKGKFTNWVDYLSIERIYYDFETCKCKVREYLIRYNIEHDYMKISIICDKLCSIDKLFPPNDLWTDYYEVRDLRDIIIFPKRSKRTGIINKR